MAFDTPARIAVVGAGPIGLEAALYARFLGYDVDLYERGFVADHVRRWGHVELFTPFARCSSSLGRRAIEAQDPTFVLPGPDEILTGQAWIERYLLPLSQTDLLEPSLHEQCRVMTIGHEEFRRTASATAEVRGDYDFQLLLRDSGSNERWAGADIVLDATGVWGTPSFLGPAGMPAAGEIAQRGRIEYGLPDVLGRDRPLYAGKRILLCGSDLQAAMIVSAVAQLATAEPGTSLVWVMPAFADREGDDLFPHRQAIWSTARQLAKSPPSWLVCHAAQVRSIQWQPAAGRFGVAISGETASGDTDSEGTEATYEVERIIGSTGHRPDWALTSELPLELDARWEAPKGIASMLDAPTWDERSGPVSTSANAVLTSAPNFYVLGAKSYGRHPGFLYTAGLEQIRSLFSIIGERATLDLYRG